MRWNQETKNKPTEACANCTTHRFPEDQGANGPTKYVEAAAQKYRSAGFADWAWPVIVLSAPCPLNSRYNMVWPFLLNLRTEFCNETAYVYFACYYWKVEVRWEYLDKFSENDDWKNSWKFIRDGDVTWLISQPIPSVWLRTQGSVSSRREAQGTSLLMVSLTPTDTCCSLGERQGCLEIKQVVTWKVLLAAYPFSLPLDLF